MRFSAKRPNQAGDTIVEVLIALAVVSSVLVGAFLVVQKSSLAVRDSQEHAEMLQILQGQVELVRSLALKETSETSGVFANSPKFFCIDNSNASGPVKHGMSGMGNSLPAIDADDFSRYTGPCKQGLYNVAITYSGNLPINSGVFTFTGRWNKIGGGKSQEVLTYRIYPGMAQNP
ncbi:MAG TPA: hypothetical protein VF572_01665 [Candidatus Saccharimonadales bacterium]|jgi:type II secretory pathway pseudopilin PulG